MCVEQRIKKGIRICWERALRPRLYRQRYLFVANSDTKLCKISNHRSCLGAVLLAVFDRIVQAIAIFEKFEGASSESEYAPRLSF